MRGFCRHGAPGGQCLWPLQRSQQAEQFTRCGTVCRLVFSEGIQTLSFDPQLLGCIPRHRIRQRTQTCAYGSAEHVDSCLCFVCFLCFVHG